MRYSTMFWIVLAALSGSALFYTSQQVTGGRDQLARIEKNIGQEEESLRVLQAEWSYLNQPERLEKLAQQYLDLAPMTGRQFARLAEIPLRPAAAPVLAQEDISITDDKKKKPEVPAVVRVMKPQAPAATAPVVKSVSVRPQTPPARTAPVRTPPAAAVSKRGFGDVMKSLGVD